MTALDDNGGGAWIAPEVAAEAAVADRDYRQWQQTAAAYNEGQAARRMQWLRRKRRRRMQRRRRVEAAVAKAGSKPELCIETSAIY